ncbi:hypothetical protein LCGC14_3114800 [marine sediment metagenome]|uniref:Uncharacterized protein n=1 Tax=marine sediment metagenome TaxID=412755 RepID=A0A0F8YTZ2_9ZZZZ
MAKELNIIEYPNALGSGVNVKIVHNPLFDGSLENYKNRSDCKVLIMKI